VKTHPDCLPLLSAAGPAGGEDLFRSGRDHQAVVAAIDILLPDIDLQQTPPANAIRIYDRIAAVTGSPDPTGTSRNGTMSRPGVCCR